MKSSSSRPAIKPVAAVTPQDAVLMREAEKAALNAYAPYSGFAVGAAVRTESGNIHVGANLENAAYGVGICAEVAAVAAANTAGDYEIEAIAVTGLKFWPEIDKSTIVTPCGRCRQVIGEAAGISGIDIRVLSCNGDFTETLVLPISALLPHAFGPGNLGLQDTWPKMRANLKRTGQDDSQNVRRIGFGD